MLLWHSRAFKHICHSILLGTYNHSCIAGSYICSGLRHAYSPVSMEYLDGVLVAAVACALINRILRMPDG